MGYFIRVLSPSNQNIALSELRKVVSPGIVKAEEGPDDDWSSFTILDSKGRWIAKVTRDVATEGSLAEEELAEFDTFLEEQEPQSGSAWARQYLKSINVIYAFQINTAEIDSNGWRFVQAAQNLIFNESDGILQADNEGFSNTEGFHITWDFPESVTGKWWMAVRNDDEWTTFQMELGDQQHRVAFKAGRVPDGVTPSNP